MNEIWRYQRDVRGSDYRHAEFAPDGRHVVTAALGGGIALLDTHTGLEVREFVEVSKYSRSTEYNILVARFANRGKLLLGGMGNSVNLGVWQTNTGKLVREIEVCNGNIQTLSVSGTRDEVLVGYGDDFRLVDFKTGKTIRVWPFAGRDIRAAVLDSSSDALYWGGRDRTIFIGKTTRVEPVAKLEGHTGGVVGLALSAKGDLLASVSVDRHLILWDAKRRTPIAR